MTVAIDWTMRETPARSVARASQAGPAFPKDFERLAETLATFVTVVSTELPSGGLPGCRS
jgi:hypothetical protein